MLPIPTAVEETTETQKKPKAPKVAKEPKVIPEHDGAVFYADAGVRPTNPGPGGWGVHGYTYSVIEPKKGTGNPSFSMTNDGYIHKSQGPNSITPMAYVDGYGTLPHITNNGAEIIAAKTALEYANRFPIKKFTLYTDSSYVVKGTTDFLQKWKKNNWIKTDGNEVANKTHWEALDAKYSELLSKGVQIDVKWVKAHNGDQGNELADKYATMGTLASARNKSYNCIVTTPSDKYWSGTDGRHPFISHRRAYMTTSKQYSVKGEYYLGTHGKEDDLLGKRMADGAYAYVRLNEPDPYIEVVRSAQLALANTEDTVVMMRLDKLYDQTSRTDLMRFGEAVLHKPHPVRNDLFYITGDRTVEDKEPITKELKPPRIAMRAIEALNYMKGLLISYEQVSETELIKTDITDLIYEKDEKGRTVLKKDFVAGFIEMDAEVNYDIHGEIEKESIKLVMGVDIPERNALKKLEELEPKVTVVTWKESDKCFRYATVFEAKDATSIWCGFYTNYKYLLTEEEKAAALLAKEKKKKK